MAGSAQREQGATRVRTRERETGEQALSRVYLPLVFRPSLPLPMLPASCPAVTGQGCAGPIPHLRPRLLLGPAQEATTLALPQPVSCMLALVLLEYPVSHLTCLPPESSLSLSLRAGGRQPGPRPSFLSIPRPWIPVQTFPPVSL